MSVAIKICGLSTPETVDAAIEAGADGITAHLREDRRHIRDADMAAISAAINIPLNFEMAATPEMQAIALGKKTRTGCYSNKITLFVRIRTCVC